VRRPGTSRDRLRWVVGDEVYGAPTLRSRLEEHEIGYVLGVKKNGEVTTAAGRSRVDALAGLVPESRVGDLLLRRRLERPVPVRPGV